MEHYSPSDLYSSRLQSTRQGFVSLPTWASAALLVTVYTIFHHTNHAMIHCNFRRHWLMIAVAFMSVSVQNFMPPPPHQPTPLHQLTLPPSEPPSVLSHTPAHTCMHSETGATQQPQGHQAACLCFPPPESPCDGKLSQWCLC